MQQPLEIWLGGKGTAALERVARAGDGWLTSAVTPQEAGQRRVVIERRAAELGRRIDPEHFGISIPCALGDPREAALEPLRQRRADGDLTDIVAVGPAGLRLLVEAHLGEGLSKFVLRPINALEAASDWRTDLEWWAETVLPLQI